MGLHTQENASKLEGVQREPPNSSKTNTKQKNASVTNLMQQLNWPTLQERRVQAQVFMLYKIVNNLVTIPAPTVHKPNSNTSP